MNKTLFSFFFSINSFKVSFNEGSTKNKRELFNLTISQLNLKTYYLNFYIII